MTVRSMAMKDGWPCGIASFRRSTLEYTVHPRASARLQLVAAMAHRTSVYHLMVTDRLKSGYESANAGFRVQISSFLKCVLNALLRRMVPDASHTYVKA